jgi:hypothetical protein
MDITNITKQYPTIENPKVMRRMASILNPVPKNKSNNITASNRIAHSSTKYRTDLIRKGCALSLLLSFHSLFSKPMLNNPKITISRGTSSIMNHKK